MTPNLKIVNFLDVTFNLNNGTFKPFAQSARAVEYTDWFSAEG